MHKTPEITRLIHDNFWIVLSFAFGQPAVAKVIDAKFHGEWKYLNRTVHELAEVQADRALLAMATQLRILDDSENLNDKFKQLGGGSLGTVVQADRTNTDLYLRDLTNKVMHAAGFSWDLSNPEAPAVICVPHDGERWVEARIELVPLMGYIGQLMY